MPVVLDFKQLEWTKHNGKKIKIDVDKWVEIIF